MQEGHLLLKQEYNKTKMNKYINSTNAHNPLIIFIPTILSTSDNLHFKNLNPKYLEK